MLASVWFVLLIEGKNSNGSTEFITVDGSGASPEAFSVRHDEGHCTIKISEEVIMVTGGYQTEDKYQLTNGRESISQSVSQSVSQSYFKMSQQPQPEFFWHLLHMINDRQL